MENIIDRLQGMASSAGSQAYDKIVDILPEAALAILIIGVGLLISSALYFITIRILAFFAIDKLAGKTPLQRMLRNVGIMKNVSDILALLVFWLGILITLIFAADTLQLEQVSNTIAVVTRFIPQIIAALLIIIFGMLLAKFLQVFVEQTVGKAKIKYASTIGKSVYIIVLILVLHLVIQQLGFDLSFITTNVIIVFCTLLFIIAVGAAIGARTLLENAFACYQLKQTIKVGDRVSIEEVSGHVKAFTWTSVVVESNESETVLPALDFFTHTYSLKRKHGDE